MQDVIFYARKFENLFSHTQGPFKSYISYRLTHGRKGGGDNGTGGGPGGCLAGVIGLVFFCVSAMIANAVSGDSTVIFIIVFLGILIIVPVVVILFVYPQFFSELFAKKKKADSLHDENRSDAYQEEYAERSISAQTGGQEEAKQLYAKRSEWFASVKECSQTSSSANPHWENGRYFDLMCLAGSRYRLNDEALDALVETDERLILKREPENLQDPKAIAVYTQDGRAVGYLPKNRNSLAAALMDGGTRLFGRVFSKAFCEDGLHIAVEIYIETE